MGQWGLVVVALLAAGPVAAQNVPDFSGHWVLDSASSPSLDVATTLMVRHARSKDLTVTREDDAGSLSETYRIGVVGGSVPGSAGGPYRHWRVVWEGQALIVESGTYTGRAQGGDWTTTTEVWSLNPDGRLTVAITLSGSSVGTTTATAVYRRTARSER